MEIHGLSILNCLITIGDEDSNDTLHILDKITVNEVVNLQIKDSYQTLINTATVKFTRQITIKPSLKDEFEAREVKLVDDKDSLFRRGERINIKLCYGIGGNLKTMFDGYIASIISGNSFALECKDMGYILKRTALDPIEANAKGTKINESVPKILKGIGVKLHPSMKEMNMEIDQIIYPQSCAVVDILNRFEKWGIMCYMRNYNDIPHLAIGRTFFSVNTSESLLKDMPDTPYDIEFDENVAEDSLSIHKLDPALMALETITMYPDSSMFKATIRRDPKDTSKFQVINETKISKNQLKNTLLSEHDKNNNLTNQYGGKSTKTDLSTYNIRTFHEYNVNRNTLIKSAEAKFGEISQTGIDGDITIFGDFGLQAGYKVRLTDNLSPERNGTYVISEAIITFGVRGHRQKLKIPYKLSDK